MQRPRVLLRALAALLVALGIAALSAAVLLPRLQAAETADAQQALAKELPSAHVAAGDAARSPAMTAVRPGAALAWLRVPRFGGDWRWVSVEGTRPSDLARGPGHYTGTPLPGEPGNVAFAAHRAGYGDPFLDFDRLRPGDRVVFGQGGGRWLYEVDNRPQLIPATADWVLRPLGGYRLTLTTCWPKYGSDMRMYVRGHLVAARRP